MTYASIHDLNFFSILFKNFYYIYLLFSFNTIFWIYLSSRCNPSYSANIEERGQVATLVSKKLFNFCIQLETREYFGEDEGTDLTEENLNIKNK